MQIKIVLRGIGVNAGYVNPRAVQAIMIVPKIQPVSLANVVHASKTPSAAPPVFVSLVFAIKVIAREQMMQVALTVKLAVIINAALVKKTHTVVPKKYAVKISVSPAVVNKAIAIKNTSAISQPKAAKNASKVKTALKAKSVIPPIINVKNALITTIAQRAFAIPSLIPVKVVVEMKIVPKVKSVILPMVSVKNVPKMEIVLSV